MQEPWFEDVPVIANMNPVEAAEKLRELGEEQLAEEMEVVADGLPPAPARTFGGTFEELLPWSKRAWSSRTHEFGYVGPTELAEECASIVNASKMKPDLSLRGTGVKIALSRLRVADYPGGGNHHILFDFHAQNQVQSGSEALHFNMLIHATEGQVAPVANLPIFVGLQVGQHGIVLKCFTVNVHNDDDEKFLAFLDSDVFKQGLQLASVAQPAIAPLSEMAKGVARGVAKRRRNVPVQNFELGLDFDSKPFGVALVEGAYIAVQIPDWKKTVWSWDDWVYNEAIGEIVRRSEPSEPIPYNYIVFGVSRYTES
jgi:hypothetical protein